LLSTITTLMTMSYSSFFSSGFELASHHSPPSSPGPGCPDSTMIISRTPSREITDIEEDTTPTSMGSFDKLNATERPKLRKRRSSLTIATSPLAQIKSNTRNVDAAVQRQSIISRSRSGSVNEYAMEGNILLGRKRSGSIGIALRSRRVIRKPSGPPPTIPLPPLPLPPLSAPADGFFNIPGSQPGTPRRRPLMMRSSTTENYDQAMPSSPISASHLGNEFPGLCTKSIGDGDELMKEN